MSTNDPFASGRGGSTEMSINGLTCTLNMPKALKRRDDGSGNEVAQGLPPYNRRPAFAVDEYLACPDSWMRGNADAASFFVPVMSEHGLWLDFNGNAGHTHHVAALVSVQGINAITGRKVDDHSLEQYHDNCPVHGTKLGHERFCADCGFKWDSQNYLASNVTPRGSFWLDGFRAKDGVVRQFYFTEEMMRGVAAQVIGAERVFAIGIAFYLSREERPAPPPSVYRDLLGDVGFAGGGHSYGGRYRRGNLGVKRFSSRGPLIGASTRSLESAPQIEVAAGARVNQRIHPDSEELTFWQPKPAGTIYINYCDVETATTIIEAGKLDMTAGGEGFMQDLNVGNNP
ncbi:hypothetical protein HOB10_00610 [Candidatus Parcubacteria bacterium]|jgi:hypothetical protein|nr:hypothetical protein [Candidatus Parcubacteria bacterium]